MVKYTINKVNKRLSFSTQTIWNCVFFTIEMRNNICHCAFNIFICFIISAYFIVIFTKVPRYQIKLIFFLLQLQLQLRKLFSSNGRLIEIGLLSWHFIYSSAYTNSAFSFECASISPTRWFSPPISIYTFNLSICFTLSLQPAYLIPKYW